MLRTTFLTIVTLFAHTICRGQIDVSTDYTTGRAQISLPIFELTGGGLSIPIGLFHNGAALAIQSGYGNCGMGWNLSGGGSVSRIVRGLPDDYTGDARKGWLMIGNAAAVQNFSPSADDNLSDCSDESTDWNFLQGRGFVNGHRT